MDNRILQITKDLDSCTCHSSLSVKEALPKFDLTEGRPLMVVDDQNEFFGTLSSGDIRRAHAKYGDLLSKPVSTICNKRALFARICDSTTTIQRLLSSNIISLPIIDEDRKLTAVAFNSHPSFRIGKLNISRTSPNVFLVAEIGVNHNGSPSVAKNLIRAAKDAGCDAVKVQKRTPEPLSFWKPGMR